MKTTMPQTVIFHVADLWLCF